MGRRNEGEARGRIRVVRTVVFSEKADIKYKPVTLNQIGVQF